MNIVNNIVNNMFGSTVLLILIYGVIYYCYVLSTNDSAYNWIDARLKDINEEFSLYGYKLVDNLCDDMAPCETKYKIIEIHDIKRSKKLIGIPARHMRSLLKRIESGYITIDKAIEYIELKAKYKQNPTFKIKRGPTYYK